MWYSWLAFPVFFLGTIANASFGKYSLALEPSPAIERKPFRGMVLAWGRWLNGEFCVTVPFLRASK
jgi:hypothetical protein